MKINESLRENFKWLHQHPENSYQEYETTKYIIDRLKENHIEYYNKGLETGVIAIIQGEEPGGMVALRGDIDGLPILEQTDLSYKSTNHNMHACGHDFHTAVMIGVAIALKENTQKLHGTVKIMFQPGEEAPGGAKNIIDTHQVDDADAFIGIHSSPTDKAGTFGIVEGPVMAAVDRFKIIVTGEGSHAAHPDKGCDPLMPLIAMTQAIQTIISRNVDPLHPSLISVTKLQSGNTWNVVPTQGEIEGTIRTLYKEDRTLCKERIYSIISHTAEAYNAKAEVQWFEGPPAVINDSDLVAFAIKVAQDNKMETFQNPLSMGGDDFGLYIDEIPGVYIKVGTGGDYPIHHPKFEIDTNALEPAVEYVTRLAMEYLYKTS